jgi:hypothetical protein
MCWQLTKVWRANKPLPAKPGSVPTFAACAPIPAHAAYKGQAGLDNVCQLLAVACHRRVLAPQDLQNEAALRSAARQEQWVRQTVSTAVAVSVVACLSLA